jgi:quercetin dioxygenase-like cupin family protein
MTTIDAQVRRDIWSSGDATGFGRVNWAVREAHPDGAEVTLGVAEWMPGKGNPRHIHPNCEEVLLVLEGEVEHALEDETTVLRAGDLIVIPRNARHRVTNRSPAIARTLMVFSSPDRQFREA